uniref:Uncharacterized protein n=1 Tax=Arundo donax TaxID=35708 RepID=A0A0A9HRM7_ARUDO
MILVATILRNIMKRRGSMRDRRIQRMCISTRKASTRVRKPKRWGMDLVRCTVLLSSVVNPCNMQLKSELEGFCHQNPVQINGMCCFHLLLDSVFFFPVTLLVMDHRYVTCVSCL